MQQQLLMVTEHQHSDVLVTSEILSACGKYNTLHLGSCTLALSSLSIPNYSWKTLILPLLFVC